MMQSPAPNAAQEAWTICAIAIQNSGRLTRLRTAQDVATVIVSGGTHRHRGNMGNHNYCDNCHETVKGKRLALGNINGEAVWTFAFVDVEQDVRLVACSVACAVELDSSGVVPNWRATR